METEQQYQQIEEAAKFVRSRFDRTVEVGMILGSGLGSMADSVEEAIHIPYSEIPNFPVSTVKGHAGELVLGRLGGKTVAVMKGRVHFYEGYPMSKVVFPTRLLKALGASVLAVTNAAGGVSPYLQVGDMMLLNDHIHMMPNPLIGPNDERLGLRFPAMAHAYNEELRALAKATAERLGYPLKEGVYLGLTGPSFETPAEIRYFGVIGCNALGMSTTPEVIVANHGLMKVIGISCITNVLHAGPCEDTHQDVLDAANRTGPKMVHLLSEVIAQLRLTATPV